MFCILLVIFQTLAAVVEGGVSSGSAEALANGAGNNNGAAAGNNANQGAQNRVPLNGGALLGHLVQLGGSFFIQPVGNQAGQAPLQQLIPIGALQQGVGAFLVGQAGAANVNPQQGQVTQGARGGGLVTLFAVLPQGNAGGNQQGALLGPGQVQLIPVAGLNNQQQQAGATGGVGRGAGRLRFQRSVAARLRRTQVKAMEAEEEQEGSGTVVEGKQAK